MTRTPDQVDSFVGARIAWRRAALGLSQTALAQRLGISFQQVQKYEAGANRVSASRLHQIATILGTPVASFFPERSGADGDRLPVAGLASLRLMSATADGRAVARAFPSIPDRELRRSIARIVEALARSD